MSSQYSPLIYLNRFIYPYRTPSYRTFHRSAVHEIRAVCVCRVCSRMADVSQLLRLSTTLQYSIHISIRLPPYTDGPVISTQRPSKNGESEQESNQESKVEVNDDCHLWNQLSIDGVISDLTVVGIIVHLDPFRREETSSLLSLLLYDY